MKRPAVTEQIDTELTVRIVIVRIVTTPLVELICKLAERRSELQPSSRISAFILRDSPIVAVGKVSLRPSQACVDPALCPALEAKIRFLFIPYRACSFHRVEFVVVMVLVVADNAMQRQPSPNAATARTGLHPTPAKHDSSTLSAEAKTEDKAIKMLIGCRSGGSTGTCAAPSAKR